MGCPKETIKFKKVFHFLFINLQCIFTPLNDVQIAFSFIYRKYVQISKIFFFYKFGDTCLQHTSTFVFSFSLSFHLRSLHGCILVLPTRTRKGIVKRKNSYHKTGVVRE